MAVTRDIAAATTKAQAEVNIKNLRDQQALNVENLEETLRIQREEAQYAQRKQTQSANFPAYQLEQQAAVGIAGAEALGSMGGNGATSMSTGGGSLDPAAMMVGVAMGGAIGQNMAATMNSMMSGVQQASPVTPPPIPASIYHVAINGQAEGPYDIATLRQMAVAGTLTYDSLVWKQGMPDWETAGSVMELEGLFSQTPPPIPNV